jgi:hypothetical protein
MLVLDENVPAGQRLLLRKWRVRFRVIGVDVAAPGTTDENLIPVLQKLSRPTFFSLDRNFSRPGWAHPEYCLVWLDVRAHESAAYIRRFLRHREFKTRMKRMGNVVRLHPGGIGYWRRDARGWQTGEWHDE